MILLLSALASVLHEVSEKIAEDWSQSKFATAGGYTGESIREIMVDLAKPTVKGYPDMIGFIRPHFTPESPRLMGAWSM